MASPDIEARTQAIGRALLQEMERYRPRVDEQVEDWLLTHAVADERFRTRLLRFLDVLAAFDAPGAADEVQALFHEYFADHFPGIPRPLRWLVRLARNEQLPAPVVAQASRRAAQVFARRFITVPGEAGVHPLVESLAKASRVPSFDLLGEAVLSGAEAEAYEARYLALIADLAREPSARSRTAGRQPALQVSVKLSSLTHHFSAVDPHGSVGRVRPRLLRIAEAAHAAGIGLAVDAEQYETRDVVWAAFREVFGRGSPLGQWEDAGLVVQAYLRDAEAHAAEVVAWASERGSPFQVRLVKGAYWDYETAVAAANRWSPPVFQVKDATDRSFDRCVERLLDAHDSLHVAIASHNPRSHAYARALAEARGLPAGAIEHQTLHRTSEAMSRALTAQGWPARDYVPVGELLPGMAYLVRRILENSSQAGFLTRSRQQVSPEELLAPPTETSDSPAVALDGARFERAPAARWFDARFRAAFDAALDVARTAPVARLALPVEVEADRTVEIRSPSDPDGPPVVVVEFAGPEGAAVAVGRACVAQPVWGALGAGRRAVVLRQAADLLLARGHEFAATVVREGGRDRAGAWAEVEEAVDFMRFYSVEAERLEAAVGGRIRPRGVVAVIPPWNFSLAIPCGMVAAALATGNAAVLKPAGQTPLIAARLVALLHEAGVPSEVVQCIPGEGSRTGQALVDDRRVALVAFTGSRAVGTTMYESVLRTSTEDGRPRAMIAEMGGKNPAIVFDDADLDEAVAGVLASAFGHANQKCSAISRVLVERAVYERFRSRLLDAAASLSCGPAEDPATQVNPVIDRRASERLQAAATLARTEGRVLLDRFGPEPGTLIHGPLIVEVDAADALVVRTATEELFGPILVLTAFEDEAEAFRIANGTGYALTSAVFSRSPGRIARASAMIEAGHVYVNRTSTGARPGVEPFGGMRFSGTGPKAGGEDYLWAFLDRTDAPTDEGDVLPEASPPAFEAVRWDIALDERIATVERAAAALESTYPSVARALAEAARFAAVEIRQPASTVRVTGQETRMLYNTPRGTGLVRANGADAVWWLVAPLLAGNGIVVVDSPVLMPAVQALYASGVPSDALRVIEGSTRHFVTLASSPAVAFVACDGGPFQSIAAAFAPVAGGQSGLKALLSPLDGPQPGEDGFLRRFAWPKVIATRTLRHGANLALPPTATRPEAE
ncbi:MAG: aldehyde dehydrogenase family protein [Dehalococcoidia bacterium]|nr:MAG: aldehyde dehydrogenase family protein [Dehalococcoidia bacterium]